MPPNKRPGTDCRLGAQGQSPNFTNQIFELHVQLADITPPIWRHLAVDGGITLRELHAILQVAFNWESCHLYQFRRGDKVYCDMDNAAMEWRDSPTLTRVNDRNVTLESIVCSGDTLSYTYDFGDDWRHDIKVGPMSTADRRMNRAILLDGENAGPIENSGGPYGYMQLLDALRSSPLSQEYDDAYRFLSEHGMVLPHVCDGRSVNAALARLAVQSGGKR